MIPADVPAYHIIDSFNCLFFLGLCEAEGSCRHCADSRYSYYRCRMQDDCFIGEICDNGFCCPNVLPTFSLQREREFLSCFIFCLQLTINTFTNII